MLETCVELDAEAFEQVYEERIMEDFPAAERRPLRSIRRLYARGRYSGFALHSEEGATLAYAGFLGAEGVSSVLLDYFAVDGALRGGGVGSRFLAQLGEMQKKRGCAGVLIECETPGTAPTDAQRAVRGRRIAFYERAGAVDTGLAWRAFGVEYRLLWLPVGDMWDAGKYGEDILRLYAGATPAPILRAMTRLRPAAGGRPT